MSNARIRTIAPGITAEMIAEQTHLYYDALTGSGSVSFQGRESLFVNNTYQSLTGLYDLLPLDMADIATRTLGSGPDPVTGADLSKISVAGVSLIIKAAYDVFFNERAAAITVLPDEQATP